uniref:Uncharacterized protein n=1 Tax=Rhizophora mucronata TaxID=61149 RepID=A0A2P2PMZ7_RHIMU
MVHTRLLSCPLSFLATWLCDASEYICSLHLRDLFYNLYKLLSWDCFSNTTALSFVIHTFEPS